MKVDSCWLDNPDEDKKAGFFSRRYALSSFVRPTMNNGIKALKHDDP
jgi:hypothetical protein